MTPPARLGENAPGGWGSQWTCITAPNFALAASSSCYAEPDPAKAAARAAAIEARRIEREAAAEASRAERAQRRAAETAETKRLREERSQRRQAERARAPLTHEERSARIKAGLERARAEGRVPPKPAAPRVRHDRRPPSANRIAPEGRVSLAAAAREVGLTLSSLSNAVRRGALACVRQSQYVYVRIDEVRAYLAASAEHRRTSSLANLAAARARKSARAAERRGEPRPWAKPCPRKRGAA